METIACVLCGEKDSTVKVVQRDVNLGLSDKEFTLVQCKGCGLIYLNPRPTPAEISVYYPSEYYPLEESRERRAIDRFFQRLSNDLKRGIRQEFYGYPDGSEGRRLTLRRLLRRLLLYPEYIHLKIVGRDIIPYRGNGRILDVGCGPGKLLRVLRDWGWDVQGVDFSPIPVECATLKYGLKVRLGDLLQAGLEDNYFDVVMFNHCLEHVYQPVETLREAYRILKPGGLLLIAIPNAGSFESRLFGKWWVQWDVPRHLFHFTKQTMGRLLSMTGFHLTKIKEGMGTSFFLGSVDYVYKYVFMLDRRHGRFMKHLVARPVCLLAGHLGYGSEMKVFAKKPAEA